MSLLPLGSHTTFQLPLFGLIVEPFFLWLFWIQGPLFGSALAGSSYSPALEFTIMLPDPLNHVSLVYIFKIRLCAFLKSQLANFTNSCLVEFFNSKILKSKSGEPPFLSLVVSIHINNNFLRKIFFYISFLSSFPEAKG